MRIALVADTFSVAEGTGIARYAQELQVGLTSRGLTVEPIAASPPRLPLGAALNHALRMPYLVATKAGHFDVVHAASPITALALPLVRKPTVVTYHDVVSLRLGRQSGTAFHARLFAPLFLRVGHFADRVIADSSQTKRDIVAHLGIPADKIVVVGPGISDQFVVRPKPASRARIVGYLGALNPRKGLPFLIRSFRALGLRYPGQPVKLVLCGRRNHEYPRLARLAADLDLAEYVEFKGSLTDEQLVEAYNSFDVFVLPSDWEGFGFTILEAQRCGVPVIVRKDAHIPEEVSACCLKAGSEEDMADKIHALLTDDHLRQDLVDKGLDYSQQFTWERTVQQTLGVYEEVMA
jgi:glycosyltransferase involved in cell wall biosynthesis